jgi:uncharacterized membrane protein
MRFGLPIAGKVIYGIYRNFCHQFAFRSWFLFGEQAYYPISSVNGIQTYQKEFSLSPNDLFAAQAVLGNEKAGYKLAFCQRDLAMYAAMLIFGIFYSGI